MTPKKDRDEDWFDWLNNLRTGPTEADLARETKFVAEFEAATRKEKKS